MTAIALIKDQGEGTSTTPEEGAGDKGVLAHYYTFAEIYYGNKLERRDSAWRYAIAMPQAHSFSRPGRHAGSALDFRAAFDDMLSTLLDCWVTKNGNIGDAITKMISLQAKGVALIHERI